ncbi:phytase [Arthrobacter sp. ISL-28]|uniref:phytase n=1 Tax=Arthrobacter sp. ISL-28 TaxID=2819108 RepID=UPI001BE593F2|nr:phytase [Arthrobacter sp. ISL-28]MBT2519870.1 phytase [Arthrobacter sp. ISL-28]
MSHQPEPRLASGSETTVVALAWRRSMRPLAAVFAPLLALASLVALWTAGAGVGAEEMVTLTVAEDGYVSSGSTGSNYGTASMLGVDASPTEISYLKFDLGAYAGRQIIDATLQLRATSSGSNGTQNVKLVSDDSWTETGITYDNKPALGTAVGKFGPTSSNTNYNVPLTADSLPTDQFLSLGLDSGSGDGLDLGSGETNTPPKLVLTLGSTGGSTGDTTAPTVAISSPSSGTHYANTQTVDITATVSDDVGVNKVEFFDNGVYEGSEDTAPFSYTWSVSAAGNGPHIWTARAYDAAGNAQTSAPVDVTVDVKETTTPPPTDLVAATVETAPVPHSGDAADDVAVWMHPTDPSLSTVIGTDKLGGLAVYDLSGQQLAYYPDSKPNNVDIRYNFPLGGQLVTLVVTSDRTTNSLRAYTVDSRTRSLKHVSARTLSVGIGLYGLCMYRSPSSGKYYAFDSDSSGTLQQWELFDNAGKVDARKVRQVSIGSTTEGCVADDETGAFYLAEEDVAIWRYDAEPTAGTTRTKVDGVGDGRLVADVEGLSIYYGTGGTGYLIASSQGNDTYVVYDRKAPNAPVKTFAVQAGTIDAVSYTDGLDVISAPLGVQFPEGAFITQDDRNDGGNQNYKLVPWGAIARSGTPLAVDTGWDPRKIGGPK